MEVKKKTLVKPILAAREVDVLNEAVALIDAIIDGNDDSDVIVGEAVEICTIHDLMNLRGNLNVLACDLIHDLTKEKEPVQGFFNCFLIAKLSVLHKEIPNETK